MNAPPLPVIERAAGATVELKAAESGEIRGLASPFGGDPDRGGDVIEAGAFAESLVQHRRAGTAPIMLWAHDMSRILGRWTAVRETGRGLEVEGKLNLKTEAGRDAYEHLRAGDLNGLSIGYRVAMKGALPRSGGGRLLKRLDLVEISLVAVPMAPTARVSEVKHLTSRAELRDLLREAGLAKGAAEKIATAGWPALAGQDPDEETKAANLAAEIRRVARLFGE